MEAGDSLAAVSSHPPLRELQKTITGVSQHVLTKQLRELESDGLITRKVFAEVPPRVEYTMTDATRELEPTIKSLMAWWENHGSNTRGQA